MTVWADLLPPEVAAEQERWSFRQRILVARKAGATLNEIAGAVGRSSGRIRQHAVRAEREMRAGFVSPVETYFAQCGLGAPVKFSRPQEEAPTLTPKEFRERLLDAKRRHDDAKQRAAKEAAQMAEAERLQMWQDIVFHAWRMLPRGRRIGGEIERRRLLALQGLFPERKELKYRIADIENRILQRQQHDAATPKQ